MRERRDAPEIIAIPTSVPSTWPGWRFDGQFFVSPDGDQVTPRRLRGLIWRDAMELRRAGFASRKSAERNAYRDRHRQLVKVVVVDLADYRANGLAVS